MVAGGPAVPLGNGQSEETDVAESADDRRVDRLATVPFGGVRPYLAVDELGREPADGRLLLGELEVHPSKLALEVLSRPDPVWQSFRNEPR